ncbi:hypothetical protein EGO58_01690 [Limosilactobacillus reuteri]|uniref:hypothetical protein n=1 Tax=Limosilactobacillus reuteri TaxID=1598 RepID=UPI000F4FD047|nr:hypothetical protein [Limosilactobacillus reuteri]MDZ5437924.1 hypothetical protein [Limosilactobacillus reuteri]ROV63951.1 hypothetical protein EGO58_01690 [Limosilactobacillus reuteri]
MKKNTVHVSVLNKDYEVQGRTIDAYCALEYQKAQAQLQADTMRQSLKKSESVADDAENAVSVYESGMKMIKGQLDFIQNMLDLSDADAKKLWNLGSIERQVLVQEILGYAEGKSKEQVEADIQDLKSNLEEQAEASNESGNKKATK